MPYISGRSSASRGFFGGGSKPAQPTNLSSIAGNQQLTISFNAPSFDGGLAISNYEYLLSTNGGTTYGSWIALSPPDTSSPIVISGLTNGQQYFVKLRAVNGLGGGEESAPLSTNTTPLTVPGAPTIGTASSGDRRFTISWSAPSSNGGSAITGYRVQYTTNNGSTWSSLTDAGNVTSYTWTVSNGVQYKGRVLAYNASGDGAYSSASTGATPTFAAPSVSVATIPGYPNTGDASTWSKRPQRITFSPTPCENYSKTVVTTAVYSGATYLGGNVFGPDQGYNWSTAANQVLDVYTYSDFWGGVINIGLDVTVFATVETYNSENFSVSATSQNSTGSGQIHYTYATSTWNTDTIKVTGGSFSRTYFDWFANTNESVRYADVRANTSSTTDNTVTSSRNPSLGLSSASSPTGTGGDSVTMLALNGGSSWPISGGSTYTSAKRWNHTDLNTAYTATANGNQRYSVVGGGTLTGTWAAANQINVKLTVTYETRYTNYI